MNCENIASTDSESVGRGHSAEIDVAGRFHAGIIIRIIVIVISITTIMIVIVISITIMIVIIIGITFVNIIIAILLLWLDESMIADTSSSSP